MVVALLTAAGSGTRMHQDIPKQFIHVDNKPVIIHTMEAFQKHPSVDAIMVVTIDSWSEVLWAYAKQFNITKLRWVIPGGTTGQESIRNGLDALIPTYVIRVCAKVRYNREDLTRTTHKLLVINIAMYVISYATYWGRVL